MLAILIVCSTVSADDADMARAVAEGWRSNYESFSTIHCRYRRTSGVAENRDKALRGELRESRSVRVLWLVDGPKERCSTLATAADLREFKEKLQAELEKADESAGPQDVSVSGFTDDNYLALGDVRMHSNSMLGERGGMTLYGETFTDEEGGNDTATPFSMGVMGPGVTKTPADLIEQWLDERLPVEVRRSTGPSGRELVAVRLDIPSGGARTYEFDPERGCLTERIVKSYDATSPGNLEVVITDIKECSNGRWFPMRSVRMNGPVDDPAAERYVTILEVEHLDVDNPPRAEEFAISFPKGAYVNERTSPRTQFRFDEPTTVTPEDLPGLVARALAKAEQYETYEAAKVLAQQPERRWLSILTVLVLLLLGVIFAVKRLWWSRT